MARDLERKGGNQFIINFVTSKVGTGMNIGLQNAMIHGIKEAGDQINIQTRQLFELISLNLIDKSALKQVNHELAQGAQQRIVAQWKTRLPHNAPGYRGGSDPDKNRLVGVLGRVLNDSEMLAFTTDRTISFLNLGVLNRDARHFLRVNYGAQGPNLGRGRSAERVQVTASGVTIATLRDPISPRPQSFIPATFISGGPKYFAPTSKGVVAGKGHAAAHFTDLGVEYLRDNFGPSYQAMFSRLVRTTNLRQVARDHGIDIQADLRTGPRPSF